MSSIIDDCKKEMDDTVAAFKRDLARLRTARATTALLDGIIVEYYGAKTPLNQLASMSAPEPRLLVVQPFDRSVIGEIERAIMQSDLGLTPRNDGKIIRIPIPELTEERRRDLVKHVKKVAEEFRVSVRAHRRDAIEMMKELNKEKELTDDDLKRDQDRVEHLTKEYVEKLDRILKTKEEEIMAV
ncbi:MAG: ribosome recycling factor [Polyangiaceae bacterium UTPRO1]|jgi:ribosome recycling factor|nr:ribosome recycling factor [Myxococcales bacterium]OQY68694.1 MAG: ribosome recycling factor [Polyangiaceae bacterium UTPRO1]